MCSRAPFNSAHICALHGPVYTLPRRRPSRTRTALASFMRGSLRNSVGRLAPDGGGPALFRGLQRPDSTKIRVMCSRSGYCSSLCADVPRRNDAAHKIRFMADEKPPRSYCGLGKSHSGRRCGMFKRCKVYIRTSVGYALRCLLPPSSENFCTVNEVELRRRQA